VGGGRCPAGQPAVGVMNDREGAWILRIGECAEHVPLVSARVGVTVRGEGGRVLAGREVGVVGRRLRPGGVGGHRWHEETGQKDGKRREQSSYHLKYRGCVDPAPSAGAAAAAP